MNNKKAPFDDARVRTALKLTLDRDIIADKIMGQGQIPAYALTPPFTHGISPEAPAWSKQTQAERNASAKQLLAVCRFQCSASAAFHAVV